MEVFVSLRESCFALLIPSKYKISYRTCADHKCLLQLNDNDFLLLSSFKNYLLQTTSQWVFAEKYVNIL